MRNRIYMAEPEEFLCRPTAEDEAFRKTHTRSGCSYLNLCERFRLRERNYVTQYAHIYFTRLEKMRPYLENAAAREWGNEVCVKNVKKRLLEAEVGERCCIIGTLFKKMELKPSILKEISTSHHLLSQPPRAKLTSSSDQLVVEDSSQRFPLSGNIPSPHLVTGVLVALLGTAMRGGVFEVEDYTFAGLPSREESVETEEQEEEERYVLLVSGLGMGSSWCDQLSLEMFVDYVTGQLGGVSDQRFCSSLVRVIVAGNSITPETSKNAERQEKKPHARFQTRNYSADTVEAVKEMDNFLAQLTSCVPVDLMPGANDPANYQLPQQPLHLCMFPRARATGRLSSLTNPYHTVIGGTVFMGCSGQNVDDIYKFSSLTDRLEILENTLQWRHMLPTSPDTLNCYPYQDQDPFIMNTCPHVYFCGNQPSFQSGRITGCDGQSVLTICVPSFDLTHSAVLVRLRGGESEVQEIEFGTSLSHAPNPHLEAVLKMQKEGEEKGEGDGGQESRIEGEMTLLHLMDDDDDD
ncbi:DNA polymerase delta subunit 2 [Geodia barretti]|uniref:DNA polymerase delta subunit 2 n=1 Tax=Geodia barretti TaxID=519541 RepID=A0AA35XJP0_GEOBA|nr:DNA polymerase delta subunit 2 [Geodia barretti]